MSAGCVTLAALASSAFVALGALAACGADDPSLGPGAECSEDVECATSAGCLHGICAGLDLRRDEPEPFTIGSQDVPPTEDVDDLHSVPPIPSEPFFPEPSPSNAGYLDGPPIGDDDPDDPPHQKVVGVALGPGSLEGLTVDGAWVMTGSTKFDPAVYVAFPVSNDSGAPLCRIKAASTYLSASGQVLGLEDSYVIGTIGRRASGSVDDHCLRPGESGWVFHISWNDGFGLNQVAGIETTLTAEDADDWSPQARVLPDEYSVDGRGITLQVGNVGPVAARVHDAAALVIDEAGRPVAWMSFNLWDDDEINPGEAAVSEPRGTSYNGKASRLLVIVSYREIAD